MTAALRVGAGPLTTLDFPDHLACVLFCQGCGWRCRYCHNPQLIPACGNEERPWSEILASSSNASACSRRWCSAAASQPCRPRCPRPSPRCGRWATRSAQHSAGIKPKLFAGILPLVDWVGFDVKALPEQSTAITGVDGSGKANWRSLEHLLESGVEHECRTTVHWQLFDADSLWDMAQRLRRLCRTLRRAMRAHPRACSTTTLLRAAHPTTSSGCGNAWIGCSRPSCCAVSRRRSCSSWPRAGLAGVKRGTRVGLSPP